MNRSWKIQVAIFAAMAATAVILLLNYLEVDRYPKGLDSPPGPRNAEVPIWLPRLMLHGCVYCETCPHRFVLSECRLSVTVTDHDGWYRLFWAGDDTYVYDDPAQVVAALQNTTAEVTDSIWTIRGRYVPVEATDPHPCPAAAGEVELRYRLRHGAFPGFGRPAVDPSGTLAVARAFYWVQRKSPNDRAGDLWWELENPDSFAGTRKALCPCGR